MRQNVKHSLEEAKRLITHWRTTHTKRRPIPESVWDVILPLIGKYTYSAICSELIISYQQIKDKLKTRAKTPLPSADSFISIDLPENLVTNEQSQTSCKLQFTRPDGVSLEIDGLSCSEINAIVTIF
ncbi:MAG: hypothetical protein AB7I18_04295 [Candidatus Berkiella sp.]